MAYKPNSYRGGYYRGHRPTRCAVDRWPGDRPEPTVNRATLGAWAVGLAFVSAIVWLALWLPGGV